MIFFSLLRKYIILLIPAVQYKSKSSVIHVYDLKTIYLKNGLFYLKSCFLAFIVRFIFSNVIATMCMHERASLRTSHFLCFHSLVSLCLDGSVFAFMNWYAIC